MLLCPLLISTFTTDPSSKQSITQPILHQLKLSFSLLDVTSTRWPISQWYRKSSSLLTPSMQQDQYLTLLFILSKFTQPPFPKNLGNFSPQTVTTQLSSGNVLANVTGPSSKPLTVTPNGFAKFWCSPCKSSWDFSKKKKSVWQHYSQLENDVPGFKSEGSAIPRSCWPWQHSYQTLLLQREVLAQIYRSL